ncbi:MAG: RsmE family RNA methyltransferase [Flavisolibacter sp.]
MEQIQDKTIVLDEDTSKHMIGVLRMEKGMELLLTNGKGKKAKAAIIDPNRKKTVVEILATTTEEKKAPHVAVAVSLIKNSSRFEWFLEKATELGITEIIPMICARTEKEKFRADRLQSILVSALLQSQQCWLPLLHEPISFNSVLDFPFEKKFIAHCLEEKKQELSGFITKDDHRPTLVLIGPEGDFTPEEIHLALSQNFLPVALGSTRLRTETAALAAAVLLRL